MLLSLESKEEEEQKEEEKEEQEEELLHGALNCGMSTNATAATDAQE